MKDLDCLLKCGDVPGLFSNEDRDNIISQIKTNKKTKKEAYAYFIEVDCIAQLVTLAKHFWSRCHFVKMQRIIEHHRL